MDKAPDAFRTISEVAADLNLPQHVLRFWETRFGQIKPMKRGGGRRYYRPEDVDLLRGIRHLLYGEGYTIRGVQRILKDEGIKFVQSVWKDGAPQPDRSPAEQSHSGERAALARPLPGRGARGDSETERGRGLFGLLPSLLGSGSEDQHGADPSERTEPRIEPSIEDIFVELPALPRAEPESGAAEMAAKSSTMSASPAPAGEGARPGMPPEAIHRLQAMLHDLDECRRMLESALTD